MAIGGSFVAGSIISKLIMDTTKWDKSVKTTMIKTARLGTAMTRVGGMLTKKLTIPLALAGAAAVKTAADFEQKLVNAFSVTGSSSEAVKKQMEDLAREMGATTVFAATEAADAMYYMASAGWKADDMAAALKDTLDLAAATQSDLAFTTEAVINSINQFGLTSADAGRVSNVFAAAISGSQATMDRLKISMSYAGPVMNALGKSIEETTSILMGMYNAGIEASTAGTALRMGLTKLMVPTQRSAQALKKLGLTFDDVNPKTNDLADIIQLLGERGAEADDIINLFGQRAGPAFAALIGKGGDALKEFQSDITGTRRASEMADMQIDTLKGSFKLLTSALAEAGISIGQKLAPAIRAIADKIREAVTWFNNLSEGTKTTIVKVGLLVAAIGPLMAIFGRLLLIIPQIGTAMTAALGPAGLLTAALIFLGVKAIEAGKYFKESMDIYQKEMIITGEKVGWFKKTWGSLNAVWDKYTLGIDTNKLALQAYAKEQEKVVEKANAFVGGIKFLNKGIGILSGGLGTLIGLLPKVESGIGGVVEVQSKWIEKTEEIVGYFRTEVPNAARNAYQIMKDSAVDMQEKTLAATYQWGESNIKVVRDMHLIMGQTQTGYKDKTLSVLKETKSKWFEVSERIQDEWTRSLGEMLSGATSFKDGLKAMWDAVKRQFFDLVAQMITKWTMGFLKTMLTSTTETIASVGKTITKGIGDVAKSIGGAAGAPSALAMGIGAAAGTFLGTVLGGGGMSKATETHLRLIHQNTSNINAVLRIDYKEEVHIIQNLLRDILPRLEVIPSKIDVLTKVIKNELMKLAEILKGVPSAQHGMEATFSEPALIRVGDAPFDEHVSVRPANQPPQISMEPVNLSFEFGPDIIKNALIEFVPEMTKDGHIKIHANCVKDW